MRSLSKRIKTLENKSKIDNPLDGLSMAELMKIIDSHDWTEEELEECSKQFGITYRSLLDIARLGA